ncbi:MAG: GNAT family N-acetyltransferase, partial [Thermodesulfobacteriota bacterium]|nr:GNAT family N-acetyltransferase [Thermodesulfobacteriota bacterium]
HGDEYLLSLSGDDSLFSAKLYKRGWIGKATATLEPPDEMVLVNIIIFDDSQGFLGNLKDLIKPKPTCRRRGLGTVLLKSVIAYARKKGVKRIRGSIVKSSMVHNPGIIQWYQENGFDVVEATSQEVPGAIARICMELAS